MKVLVVYHSVYGHVLQLARAVEEGVKSVSGVEAVFRRAPEFPHAEKELEAGDGYASKVWQDQKKTQPCTLDDLREANGLLLGSPTRYGNMTAQMKALIDSTASLWLSGAMEGKPAGVFTSTASTHGGQENDLCDHDDPSPSPRNAYRRCPLFDRRHDPHRSAWGHTLRGNDDLGT
jgi:NAD(P)H dehydrogenase (quinone)